MKTALLQQAVKGVTVTVDGMESTLRAMTDATGSFRLDQAPAGAFFVHTHGYTATNKVEDGSYYPFVGKRWQSVPGRETDIGDIYLPLIPRGTLQSLSDAEATTITFPPEVITEHPELEGVSITVPRTQPTRRTARGAAAWGLRRCLRTGFRGRSRPGSSFRS